MIKKIFTTVALLLPILTANPAHSLTIGKQACLNGTSDPKMCGMTEAEIIYKRIMDTNNNFKTVMNSRTPEELYDYTKNKTRSELIGFYKDDIFMSVMYHHYHTGNHEKVDSIMDAMHDKSCFKRTSKDCEAFIRGVQKARFLEDFEITKKETDDKTTFDKIFDYKEAAGKLGQLDIDQCPGVEYKEFSRWKHNGITACNSQHYEETGSLALGLKIPKFLKKTPGISIGKKGGKMEKISGIDECAPIIQEVKKHCPGVLD